MKNKLLIPKTINQNSFDFFRVLLALSVILCHSYVIYLGWDSFVKYEPFMKWTEGQISIGSTAVNFFFVISGFLIIRSFKYSKNVFQYFKKRILRIYPGFIVVFIMSFFVFGPIGHMKSWNFEAYRSFLEGISVKREIANMLSLQSPIENKYFTNLPQTGLNNSLWTIQYEFICYLMIPVFAWLGILKRKSWLLVTLIIIHLVLVLQSLGYILSFNQNLNGIILSNPYYYPRFFTYFLLGCTVYHYKNIIPRNIWFAVLSAIIFLLGFTTNLVDIFWPISGTYLLFYMAYEPKIMLPNFAKHGDLSYGIYLYGWPVQQLIMLYFGSYLNSKLLFVVVTPVVVIFAIMSWKLVESPMLKLKNKRILGNKNRIILSGFHKFYTSFKKAS